MKPNISIFFFLLLSVLWIPFLRITKSSIPRTCFFLRSTQWGPHAMAWLLLFPCTWWAECSPSLFWQTLSSPNWMVLYLCWKPFGHICKGWLRCLLFCPSVCLYLGWSWDWSCLWRFMKSTPVSPSTLFSFMIASGPWGPLDPTWTLGWTALL